MTLMTDSIVRGLKALIAEKRQKQVMTSLLAKSASSPSMAAVCQLKSTRMTMRAFRVQPSVSLLLDTTIILVHNNYGRKAESIKIYEFMNIFQFTNNF